MTITELIPTVQGLSHTDKLLLLQILVQELVKAEANNAKQPSSNDAPITTADPPDGLPEQPEDLLTAEDEEDALALAELYAFLKKPVTERRRILAEQADAMQAHYEQNTEWQELMSGDIVEY